MSGDPRSAPPTPPSGRRRAVKARPGTHPPRQGSTVSPQEPKETPFRKQAAGRPACLPPSFKDSSAPRSRPPQARGGGPEPRTHHRCSSGPHRPPGRAGLRADAKFKPRRRSEEAARGIAGGAAQRSTMGGSASPGASAPWLQRLRRG